MLSSRSRGSRHRSSYVGALAVVALTGCTAQSAGTSASTSPSGAPASSAATTSAPPPAPVVTTSDGPCPYLETSFVQGTVGQKVPKVVVTTTEPAPGPAPKCEFFKPNNEAAATVETLTVGSVAAAQQAALGFAPGGNPVSAGDGGSVLVKRGEALTVLGTWRGTTVVLVTINQESSLEATEIAKQVLTTLP